MINLRKKKEGVSFKECLLQRKLQLRRQKIVERVITNRSENEPEIGFKKSELYNITIKNNTTDFNSNNIVNSNNNEYNDNIFELTLIDLQQSQNTENQIELKRYLFEINKISLLGKTSEIETKILNNFSTEKTQFIFDLLFTNINSNPTTYTLTNINFQYECLTLLINLIIDTNKYNNIFLTNLPLIYNYILTLSTQPHLISNNSQLQIIYYHFIWLLGNIIQGYNQPFPNDINIPQLISNIYIHYNSQHQILSYNIWLLSIYLYQMNVETYVQYIYFIDTLLTLIGNKHNEIPIVIITNILQVISLLIKNEICFNYIMDKYNFIIFFLINSYTLYATAQQSLIYFIKYDKQNIISRRVDIYNQIIYDILFKNKKEQETDMFIHTLRLFRYLIIATSSLEDNCVITRFIKDKEAFSYFQLYYMNLGIDDSDRKMLKNVYKILYELFDRGSLYVKKYLCENNLHMYFISEIRKLKNNEHCFPLIVIILKSLANMLQFEKQSNNILNYIKNELENENFDSLLLQLQMSKHPDICKLANMIVNNYYKDEIILYYNN